MEALFPVAVLVFLCVLGFRKKGSSFGQISRELAESAKKGVERIASDGHKISAEDDISCAWFGHDHSKDEKQDNIFPDKQFIVHNEPQQGYINLNGKILKRSEADEYMRRHG